MGFLVWLYASFNLGGEGYGASMKVCMTHEIAANVTLFIALDRMPSLVTFSSAS